jgi:hypothetical protein
MVYIDAQYRMDPVTITSLTVGNQQVQPGMSTGPREVRPGAPFQADEDWLKNMSVSLLNRTNKMIVRAEMEFVFPDTGDGSSLRPVTAYTLAIGQRPEIDSFTSHGQRFPQEAGKHPLLFAPGQTLVVRVGDYVDAMQPLVEQKIQFAQVATIAIRRVRFYFVDGMRWDDLNGYGVPDPSHPGQFTSKDRGRYFPGRPSENWPPPTQQAEPGHHASE